MHGMIMTYYDVSTHNYITDLLCTEDPPPNPHGSNENVSYRRGFTRHIATRLLRVLLEDSSARCETKEEHEVTPNSPEMGGINCKKIR